MAKIFNYSWINYLGINYELTLKQPEDAASCQEKWPRLEKGQATLWFPLVASSLVRAVGSTDATDKTVSTVTPDSVNTTNWSHFGKPRYCSKQP